MQKQDFSKNADAVFISGDYQKRALTEGSRLQRSWHAGRLELLQLALAVSPDDVLADIGCGSGISIEKFAPLVRRAYGVDSNLEAVRFCRENFVAQKNVEILQGTLDKTGIAEKTLTKIICTEVLEHVYLQQIPGILAHWKTLLKPSGQVFITVPNDQSIWPIMEWCADRLHLVPHLADDQHVSHWTPAKLKSTLKEAGFTQIKLGSFNLVSPLAYMFGLSKLGRSVSQLELKHLSTGGPLIWACATLA
jgi:2-polyprenyl-3-methyl-5-hydroxy-6-metoxy-1,4-benzoquinol methylase